MNKNTSIKKTTTTTKPTKNITSYWLNCKNLKETWPYKDNKHTLQETEKMICKKTYVYLAVCVYMFWLLSCATRRKPEKLYQMPQITQKKKKKERSKWQTDRGTTDTSIFFSYAKAFFIIQHLRPQSENDGRTGGNLSVSIASSPPSFTWTICIYLIAPYYKWLWPWWRNGNKQVYTKRTLKGIQRTVNDLKIKLPQNKTG